MDVVCRRAKERTNDLAENKTAPRKVFNPPVNWLCS